MIFYSNKMKKSAIIDIVLTWWVLAQVHCNSYNDSSTNSRIDSEYPEKTEFSDAYSSTQEDYPDENNVEEEIDYEVLPKHQLSPYENQIYEETPIRSYTNKYQPYFLPSEQMESMAHKPMASPMESQVKQQPLYANLYWRKIVYPYPPYSTQNNNENVILSENSSPELQTQESNLVNRRYISHNPYRGYYPQRNRYQLFKTMNGRPKPTNLYPIQKPRMRPIVRYYKNPGYYQRRRKVRPIKRINKNKPYFYVNNQ